MAWNKNNPAGSEKLRNSDNQLRANFAALETALHNGAGIELVTGGNQTGKFIVPQFKDNGGDPSQPTSTNEARLYNNAGVLYILTQAGTKSAIGGVPSGTKMLFKESSAPTGWTFKSEDTDKVLLNTSTEAEGGNTGGSWTISGCSVGYHTLSTSEIPNFSGRVDVRASASGSTLNNATGIFSYGGSGASKDILRTAGAESSDELIISFGGGGSHNHGFSSDGTWRPSYSKVITCEKQ